MRISRVDKHELNKRSILIAWSFVVLLKLTSETLGQGMEGLR